MKKSLLGLIVCLAMVLALSAQNVTVYHVPRFNEYNDYAPGIAANRYGDILVAYANMKVGPLYYFKKHGTDTWVGPAHIPGVPWENAPGWGDAVQIVNVVASKDGVFHVSWNMNEAGGYTGIHYSAFDPNTEKWFGYDHILADFIRSEKPYMAYNAKRDEIVVAVCLVWGFDKSIYFITKDANGWRPAKPVTELVLGETEPFICFDEEGRTFLTYKTDRQLPSGEWELVIRMDMFDSAKDYELLWWDIPSWALNGWHFFPSQAILKGGKGMLTFVFKQGGMYYYIPFEVKGNKVEYVDPENVMFELIGAPVHPHYMFQSAVLAHVDEFLFTYKAAGHSIQMINCKDGNWSKDAPLEISGGEPTLVYYPYAASTEPAVGLLTAWSATGLGHVSFSIYDYKKIVVQPPVNLKLQHITEKSAFKLRYVNVLTWENDPINTDQGTTVSKYFIYRKAKGEANYAKITEVSASEKLTYIDKVDIPAVNPYDYAVSAVDSKGNESLYTEIK